MGRRGASYIAILGREYEYPTNSYASNYRISYIVDVAVHELYIPSILSATTFTSRFPSESGRVCQVHQIAKRLPHTSSVTQPRVVARMDFIFVQGVV